jgi:hypothetical protein
MAYICALDVLRKDHGLPAPPGLPVQSVLLAMRKRLDANSAQYDGAQRCTHCVAPLRRRRRPPKHGWMGCFSAGGKRCAACAANRRYHCFFPDPEVVHTHEVGVRPAFEEDVFRKREPSPQPVGQPEPVPAPELDAFDYATERRAQVQAQVVAALKCAKRQKTASEKVTRKAAPPKTPQKNAPKQTSQTQSKTVNPSGRCLPQHRRARRRLPSDAQERAPVRKPGHPPRRPQSLRRRSRRKPHAYHPSQPSSPLSHAVCQCPSRWTASLWTLSRRIPSTCRTSSRPRMSCSRAKAPLSAPHPRLGTTRAPPSPRHPSCPLLPVLSRRQGDRRRPRPGPRAERLATGDPRPPAVRRQAQRAPRLHGKVSHPRQDHQRSQPLRPCPPHQLLRHRPLSLSHRETLPHRLPHRPRRLPLRPPRSRWES